MNNKQIEEWIESNAMHPTINGVTDYTRKVIHEHHFRELLKDHAIVPRVATHRMISAMATSSATDDQGEFPELMDLLDFIGENARHTVLRAAYRDVILAAEQETQDNEQ